MTLNHSLDPARTPVIVGVGEIADRPAHLENSLEPAALIAEALRRADRDTGGSTLLPFVDSLDVVNSVTCRYDDLPSRVSVLSSISPRRAIHGALGGESPVRLLHEAAMRIAEGLSETAIICGAEASYARYHAERTGVNLPWPPADNSWYDLLARHSHPHAVALGVAQPSTVYPFFENALQAALGQTPSEGRRRSAELWSEYAEIALQNPCSWIRRPVSADEIASTSVANRMIAWPYPKLMMANPTVNQGAAVLITSLARARQLGVPAKRMVFFWSGASAVDPRDYLLRDQFVRSPAMEAVLNECTRAVESAGQKIGAMELYSCFPCVPKMVQQALHFADQHAPSVTGGLTFFGAPLNNYMTHAACEMVRRLRDGSVDSGLLYGQGEFVTKHHALVLGTKSPPDFELCGDHSVQADADARRGPSPGLYIGAGDSAKIETHTVLFERDQSVRHGIVIVRVQSGERAIARISKESQAALDLLTSPDESPIGKLGQIQRASDGLYEWSFAR
ncbi:acetyl-CoA acetyltransferase [Caballeronia sordidicola]|uniref:acetyl-CoA acetyltransferase n=1 Tax=Caballeronia sordidicola TaxID=196367 RepID=UPI0004D03D6E|nr:acetyl-CoA acetyltransferase [Caballeronia sordidicola]